jgi:hypothetical protein
MTMRHTHTVATLAISPAAHTEIARLLRDVGYDHVFMDDGGIDMTGIGLVAAERSAAPPPSAMRLSAFARLFWHEGEWELDGKQTAFAWHPLDETEPTARPGLWGNVVTFYDCTGNRKLSETRVHDIDFVSPTLLCLERGGTGTWYEVMSPKIVWRESHGRWFIRWWCAKNTRQARAANAMMIALRADNGVPAPSVEQMADAIRVERGEERG